MRSAAASSSGTGKHTIRVPVFQQVAAFCAAAAQTLLDRLLADAVHNTVEIRTEEAANERCYDNIKDVVSALTMLDDRVTWQFACVVGVPRFSVTTKEESPDKKTLPVQNTGSYIAYRCTPISVLTNSMYRITYHWTTVPIEVDVSFFSTSIEHVVSSMADVIDDIYASTGDPDTVIRVSATNTYVDTGDVADVNGDPPGCCLVIKTPPYVVYEQPDCRYVFHTDGYTPDLDDGPCVCSVVGDIKLAAAVIVKCNGNMEEFGNLYDNVVRRSIEGRAFFGHFNGEYQPE